MRQLREVKEWSTRTTVTTVVTMMMNDWIKWTCSGQATLVSNSFLTRGKRRHCECVKEAIEKQVSVVNAHATSQNLNWECVGWQALPGQIYANEISAEVKGEVYTILDLCSMFTLSTFPISLIVLFNVPLLDNGQVLARIARTMFYKDT